jgi:hypothetical protein
MVAVGLRLGRLIGIEAHRLAYRGATAAGRLRLRLDLLHGLFGATLFYFRRWLRHRPEWIAAQGSGIGFIRLSPRFRWREGWSRLALLTVFTPVAPAAAPAAPAPAPLAILLVARSITGMLLIRRPG